jgi:pimeloyl-ACP methyl ester carboxylesterase
MGRARLRTMPAVFVHGVPETPAIWGPLRAKLNRDDIVTPQLPGFGCPKPDGFGSTKEEYVAWLVAELDKVAAADGPIDLIGHDWGGGLVVRVVSTRPDLLRSWVTDAAGIGHPDFEWHEFAKIWQTPGAGEEFFEQQLAGSDEERGAVFEMFGVPHDDAVAMGGSIDKRMTDSIIALYRSATEVGKEWSGDFKDIPAPGLVIVPSEDAFLNADHARESAATAGAQVAEFDGIGHWWMAQAPDRAVKTLESFWSSV